MKPALRLLRSSGDLLAPNCELHPDRPATYETYSNWRTREHLPRLAVCGECAAAFVEGGGAIMSIDVSGPRSSGMESRYRQGVGKRSVGRSHGQDRTEAVDDGS